MVNDEVLEAQRIAKRDGRVRFAGVSFHGGHAEMIPAMLKLNHFDVFLISYNYTMDPAIEPLSNRPARLTWDGRHEGAGRRRAAYGRETTRWTRRS